MGSHRRGRPATARAAMRSAQTERRAKVRFHYNWRADDGFHVFAFGASLWSRILSSSMLLMHELHLRDETICCFCGSDFDECSVYGTCSQSCTNTDGGYTCSCVEGYLPQPDNRSCKAKNGMYLQLPADSSLRYLG